MATDLNVPGGVAVSEPATITVSTTAEALFASVPDWAKRVTLSGNADIFVTLDGVTNPNPAANIGQRVPLGMGSPSDIVLPAENLRMVRAVAASGSVSVYATFLGA